MAAKLPGGSVIHTTMATLYPNCSAIPRLQRYTPIAVLYPYCSVMAVLYLDGSLIPYGSEISLWLWQRYTPMAELYPYDNVIPQLQRYTITALWQRYTPMTAFSNCSAVLLQCYGSVIPNCNAVLQ